METKSMKNGFQEGLGGDVERGWLRRVKVALHNAA